LQAQVSFQFHIGAIRSFVFDVNHVCHYVFQFHIGAIRSELQAATGCTVEVFQFHIGAIRSATAPLTMNPLI